MKFNKYLVIIAFIIPMGCSTTNPIVHAKATPIPVVVSGKIYGEDFAKKLAGDDANHPLQAYIQCDNIAATTAADGSYSLTLKSTIPHSCVVSARDHQLENIMLDQSIRTTFQLNIGIQPGVQSCFAKANIVNCPGMPLILGSIHGQVLVQGQPYPHATVHCSSTNPADPSTVTATSDSTGSFATTAIAPNTYFCYSITSDNQSFAQNITVAPFTPTQQQLSICANGCPALSYYSGQVMHAYTAYIIYWLPAGYSFEPNGSDQRYMDLTSQYFRDVGGTPFSRLLTQYWDTSGFVSDALNLGDTYIDTQPYQHCKGSSCTPTHATVSDPLQLDDIIAEVNRVKAIKNWTGGANTEFFVYVGNGAQACASQTLCTFLVNNFAMCGYHSSFGSNTFAFISDSYTESDVCINDVSYGKSSPNGDWGADAAISWTSHEQFESITDPYQDAWYDEQKQGSEIADLCEDNADTFNYVSLNHGHTYFVQGEWSNLAGGCVVQ